MINYPLEVHGFLDGTVCFRTWDALNAGQHLGRLRNLTHQYFSLFLSDLAKDLHISQVSPIRTAFSL